MMKSVRVRLLVMVLGTILLFCMLMAGFLWWRASSEIHAVFDAQLVQTAKLIAVTTQHESEESDLDDYQSDLDRYAYEYSVIFQVRDPEGKLLVKGPGSPEAPLSADRSSGFSNSGEWRVFSLYTRDYQYLVQTADKLESREALILKFIAKTLSPLLFMLPLLVFVWLGVNKALNPLRWIAVEVSARDQTNLEAVPTDGVPPEVMSLVNEINGLLARLDGSLARYTEFTGNVAHELRTPISGAMTQIYAAMSSVGNERTQALEKAMAGLKKLARRIEQLLILARIERGDLSESKEQVLLEELAAATISDKAPKAMSKGVEIELDVVQQARLSGNRELLEILLENLLDNAIRATPKGGAIRLEIGTDEKCSYLSLTDSGPGIPPAMRERVFDYLHRLPSTPGSGTGLGLSLVKGIAEMHAATVSLTDSDTGTGLEVSVTFPRSSPLD